MFPRLITSTVYSTRDPVVVFTGPVTSLTTTIFSSCSIVIVASVEDDVAFRLVQMFSSFGSESFA